MTISDVDYSTASFTGVYNSGVGHAEGDYELKGRFDPDGSSLGWVVSYQNSYKKAHSTASWCGQIQVIPEEFKSQKSPRILTTYLLTTTVNTKTKEPNQVWESTKVGSNKFTQEPPDEETKKIAQLRSKDRHSNEANP